MSKKAATQFVILLGVVSLFADVTYEGARSTTGPYLAFLGASAASVGIIAGLGEMIAYGLRFFSGYLSDASRRYWVFMFVGYGVNLLAVPALAIAPNWQVAAFFVLLERLGKAIRTPARDVMLTYASKELGSGKGFGLHDALDKLGACMGPLVVAGMLSWQGNYRLGFTILLIPALVALSLLTVARFSYPKPEHFDPSARVAESQKFSQQAWIFMAGAALLAAGFTDFPLIAFHFARGTHLTPAWIPILYSIAMGMSALASVTLGFLFDRFGMAVIIWVTSFTAFFSVFAFSDGFDAALIGIILWGIGIGSNDSIIKAAFSKMIPKSRLGTAFGIFNGVYGVSWFLGTALMGFLYEYSVYGLIGFSVIAQLAAIPLFLSLTKRFQL